MRLVGFRLLALALLLTLPSALRSGSSDAATTTTTFQVTANIAVTCTISASDLAFGTYNRSSGTPLDAQSNLSIDCTNGATYDVGLNQGLHGATVTTREMENNTSSGVFLNYQIFSDPARTINWGNTPGVDTVTGTGSGTIQKISVWGRIPAGQLTPTAGGYSDTITATLNF